MSKNAVKFFEICHKIDSIEIFKGNNYYESMTIKSLKRIPENYSLFWKKYRNKRCYQKQISLDYFSCDASALKNYI